VSEPARIACLPGDGIGPEVMAEALRVLRALPLDLELTEHDFGGIAIDRHGTPLPDATLEACLGADAVLLAAVGVPGYDAAPVRPEQGLIRIRKELDVYANLRPSRAEGIDLLIVRELVGGLYYGERGRRDDGAAFDTCEYTPDQIERIARRAFELAQLRAGRLLSVDKANVLETSRLWREVVTRVGADYPDVTLTHALVDSTAMRIVTDAEEFDVLLMENTFGDILSDVAAAVTGGLGLAASASVGDHNPGLFEPVHGSAPDIVGVGVANPAGILRSVALLLDLALGKPEISDALDSAVDEAIVVAPTRDLGGRSSTTDFTDAVLTALPSKEEARVD
jgi:3-isopropylmalate dehydrogenase